VCPNNGSAIAKRSQELFSKIMTPKVTKTSSKLLFPSQIQSTRMSGRSREASKGPLAHIKLRPLLLWHYLTLQASLPALSTHSSNAAPVVLGALQAPEGAGNNLVWHA
jgi:hypothetical protein